jgi:hypothetical protein
MLEGISRLKEQGAFFLLQGKEQGAFLVLQGEAALELRMRLARVARQGLNAGPQIRRDHAGLGICHQEVVTAAQERG